MIKSRQEFTNKQAKTLVNKLAKKLNCSNVYDDCKKANYYYSLTGFYKEKYYAIGIYCFTDTHKIDYSCNTEGRRVLNAILKETINQVKK